jgi:hypothetical protein
MLGATGSPARARAAWAFIHGMIILEMNGRFADDGLTETAWQSGIAAFRAGGDRTANELVASHTSSSA